MANTITTLGAGAVLGISAYLFPNQLVRIRSLVMFFLAHLVYNFVKVGCMFIK